MLPSNHLPMWPWLQTMAKSFCIIFLSQRQPIQPLSLLPLALNMHTTTTMTLCLVEKVFVQSFETSKPSTRTRSTILILLHDQWSRSTSELHALRVSTFLSYLLLECFYLEFMIFQPVSSHRSMTMDHFGSSGFKRFKLRSYTFSWSAFTKSRQSFDVCLLESMVEMHSSLWVFRIFLPNATCHIFTLYHS